MTGPGLPATALRAGASRVDITPALGCTLAGYPSPARIADRVRDPLHARTLVLQASGRAPLAIVSLDAMAIEAGWVHELRARAADALGLPPAGLLVAATHSHSTPGGLFAFDGPVGPALEAVLRDSVGPPAAALRDAVLRATLDGIAAAIADLRPVGTRLGSRRVDGVAGNRTDPRLPVDDRCRVLAVDEPDGTPVASLVHFACHPTVLADDDRTLSADFPGAAARVLEREVGGVAVFLNGALGDVSTRFTRRGRGPEEVERLGRRLGEAALAARADARAVEVDPVASIIEIALPAKRPSPTPRPPREADEPPPPRPAPSAAEEGDAGERIAAAGGRRQRETAREGARIAARLAPHLATLSGLDVEVQVVTLGPRLLLVALPLEVFSGLGTAVAALGGDCEVILVGPANGYLGYLPTAAAWERGGYEVDSALVDQAAGAVLLAALRPGLGEGSTIDGGL